MSTRTLSRAAAAYLAAVEAELADLAAEERADLLEDLADHLAALDEAARDDASGEHADAEAGSPDASGPGAQADEAELRRRLGHPAQYAAELRASAGLAARSAPAAAAGRAPLSTVRSRLAGSAAVRVAEGYRAELRVAWWTARAVLATLLLAAFTGDATLPLPAVLGSRLVGLATVVLALWGSFALGRRQLEGSLGGRAGLVTAGGVAVAIFGALGLAAGSDAPQVFYEPGAGAAPTGLWDDEGAPITNLFVYDRDGNLLRDVLVYDQRGEPVRTTGDGATVRTYATDVNGAAVPNAYPVQEHRLEPGPDGVRAGDVLPPPAVVPPRLAADGARVVEADPYGLAPIGPIAPSPVPPTAVPASPVTPETVPITTVPSSTVPISTVPSTVAPSAVAPSAVAPSAVAPTGATATSLASTSSPPTTVSPAPG